MKSVLAVQKLRKSYGSVVAVEDITFDVRQGEIFGIVGPNGAGKTTTVECLAGLRAPDSGEISVLGLDPRRHERALRQRIGIQLQEAALPDGLTVWEALDLFASFYESHIEPERLLEQWALSEKRDARFGSLSGGQKQRLFIALALLNNPELVFLDEITTGLDPQARRNTWDAIRTVREQGKTVLLVTHFMDEAETLCDRVAIIDNKRVVALDSPGALIQQLQAESRLRFTASDGQDLSFLSALPGVSRVEREGGLVTVHGRGALLAHVAGALAERGIIPEDLRSERATLEEVFIALTGRAIRD